MIWDMLIAAAAALGAALLVFLAFRLLGRERPRWIMSWTCAAAVVLATMAAQYGWAERAERYLTPNLIVVDRLSEASMFAPWTYLVPVVSHIALVDKASVRTNDAVPDVRLVDFYIMHRQDDTQTVAMVVDCAAKRHLMADHADAIDINALPPRETWISAPNQKLYEAACG